MTMNHRMTNFGGVMLMAAWSASSFAQSTLGDLLDAGGKRLSKEEVRADGTYAGNILTAQGSPTGLIGAWVIDDTGKLCAEYTIVRYGRRDKGCAFYFSVSGRFYISESDSDRNSPILERVLKK
jgi:hypothetical protein